MKYVYFDTNIVLAKWAPLDVYHSEANLIFSALAAGQFSAVFSGFGLCEIASVVERQSQKFPIQIKPNISLSLEYLKQIVKVPKLEIIDIFSSINVRISGKSLELSTIFWRGIDIANKLRLKTLDNIHIAIADIISHISGKTIDYFLTGDKEVLSEQRHIKKSYGFSVVSPIEFVNLEGI
ncbi:MAG: type II toxin-antitoxin system VapC family toxin [Candidatus Hodarchaeota archaeon]